MPRKFQTALTLVCQRFNALLRGEKRCFGLTGSQCFLIELLQRTGRCSVRELAEGLGLDQSTVTRGVAALGARRRIADPDSASGSATRHAGAWRERGHASRRNHGAGDFSCG